MKTRTRSERKKFRYEPRSKEAIKQRANQSGGMYDSIFKSSVQVLKVTEGEHRYRILPPTWSKPQDFGIEGWVHFAVGPDNQRYLCASRMKNEACAICDIRGHAEKAREKDVEFVRSLQPAKRVFAWVIDRDEEDAGPQLWNMSWTMNRDINTLLLDKRTGAVLCIDDPDKGYDIEFTSRGKGIKTKVSGLAIARRSTPLSEDEDQIDAWIEYIQAHELPDQPQFFEYDHIKSVAEQLPRDDDDDEEEERPSLRRGKHDEDDDKPSRRRSKNDDDDDEEEERPSRRRKADDEDEEERPSRRRKADEDEDEEERPSRRRKADEDEDEEERPSRRRKADDEDEEERPSRRRKADDEDEEERPSRRRKADDEDEEERPSRRRKADEDEDEEERPSRRRKADDEDEEERPSRRRKADEDEEEERPSRRRKHDDDEEEEARTTKRRSLKERVRKARGG